MVCLTRPSEPLLSLVHLASVYVAGRKFQGCSFKHIYQRMKTKLGKQVIPYANGNVVNVYCCNSWLVTRPAIQQFGYKYWEFFMNISLWHVCGPHFSHVVGRSHNGHPPHPDLGVMYEHIFHLMLGHKLTYPRGKRFEDLAKVLDFSRDAKCPYFWKGSHVDTTTNASSGRQLAMVPV